MPLTEAEILEHREIERLVKEHHTDPSWQKEETQMGVECWYKVLKNPLTNTDAVGSFGVAEVPHSAEAIITAFMDHDLRMQWDGKNFAQSVVIEDISPLTEVFYRVTNNLPWPMTQRDTVVRSHEVREPDGTVIATWKSVSNPAKPPNATYVRSTTLFGALFAKPLSPTSSLVKIAFAYDPAGSLPILLAQKSSKSQPLYIRSIQSFLDNKANLEKTIVVIERKRARRAAAGIFP